MRTWSVIAIVCLAVAGWQAYAVVGQIAHVTTNAWKFGVENLQPISAGTTMTVAFFITTAVFVALGLVATDRLQRASSPMRFCSLLSVLLLLSGAIVYGGMLCSPVVVLHAR